ncbi:MAG: MmgE/PrpD family protein [Marinobacter sp.]|uniref:MmgE/PrpD family protein n=1 Tax=Marinobacter sp. TaxID=50741 RepID=UPI003297A110
MNSHTSRPLAQFLVSARWEQMPEALIHEAKRSILNGFATAFAGCNDAVMDRLIKTLSGFSGQPQASVTGRKERFDVLTAAFLNAVSTNVFDFDDTHPKTIIHPTAPVAPALFALGEYQTFSGRSLLEAFILGVEVECRLGNAVSPGHYKRGWHITSTCGVFGAAAATGKILELDAERMIWALGNASAQASGLVETLGSMAKSVGVGNAARNGLVAALMASNGVEGPNSPLEGERGFLTVTSEAPNFAVVLENLGSNWELSKNTYKPYPCGVVLNPVIDACLEIANTPGFDATKVRSVTISGHSLLRERADRPAVRTGREAQVSAQHAAAVCLLYKSASLTEFSDEAVNRKDILWLREKVEVIVDDAVAVGGAHVIAWSADNSRLQATVRHARGDAERPLSDRDIEDKFRELIIYGRSGLNPQPFIDAIWRLDQIEDVSEVMALARL